MAQERTPILRADGGSLDWSDATYAVDVKIRGRQAIATHTLRDAPELEALVADGSARWTLEIRCPRTLLAKTVYDSEPTMVAHWAANDVQGELFVTAGLVAVRPLNLSVDGLNALWGSEPIQVPAGRWLARGTILRNNSVAASLLTFDPRESLSGGQMMVEPNMNSGDLRFQVWLSPEHFAARQQERREVQIAALIAAMGRIPHLDSGDAESYPILAYIRERLEDQGVPIWGDEANSEYDPARAATAIEEFALPAPAEDDE